MSKTFLILKTKPAYFLETAGTHYLVKRRHIPEKRLPRLCGNVTPRLVQISSVELCHFLTQSVSTTYSALLTCT